MFAAGLVFLLIMALVGAALWGLDLPRPVFVHGVFALAALPLMWSAILHFVPVLTRGGAPALVWRALPWLALGAAALLPLVFAGLLPRHVLLLPAFLLGSGALALLGWTMMRVKRTFGKPHPGVRWYLAALTFLVLGLAATFGMVLDGARFAAWWRFHLHANLLGWVGLTVLGTLPVLLPTCMSSMDSPRSQKFDPNAAFRLRRGLPWAVAGVGLTVLAATQRWPLLGLAGATALLAVLGTHWWAWRQNYGAPWRWPGPAISLLLGSGFLALLLLLGAAHGFRLIAGAQLLPAFVAGFLLPTVLGALAQLLPVWRFPGPDSAARQRLARALAAGAGWRGGLCALAGVGELLSLPFTLVPVMWAVLWLLLVLLKHLSPRSGKETPAL